MNRKVFQERIKNMIGTALSCKDICNNANVEQEVFIGCKSALHILSTSLVIDNFLIDALVGDIESIIYERLDNSYGTSLKGIEFTDKKANIPNVAVDLITNDEIRKICVDTCLDMEDEVMDSYNALLNGEVKGLRQ